MRVLEKWKFIIFALTVVIVIGSASYQEEAKATPITISGLTFTEVTADVTITGGFGTGTLLDPIVLMETVSGLDVTLSIEGLPAFGNVTPTPHTTGFWLQKQVLNDTGSTWNFFDHELQEVFGVASGDGDGLSFAQGAAPPRPWTSDKFAAVDEVLDSRDFVNFSGGSVLHGETVTFNYIITDNSPIDLFYLRQRPNFQSGVEPVPEPATVALLGIGLAGFAGATVRRRLKKAKQQ